MKKTASIFIVIILLIITGCTNKKVINHSYTYKGENELWTAEYRVNGKGTFFEKDGKTNYESNAEKTLTVSFKKDISELSSVKHLEISYESSAGGGKLTNDFDNDNPLNQSTYTFKSGGSGGAIEHKDEMIKVNINLDGKTQIIELKNVQ